nr:MAG TPA: hypothetical protein [Bacteriophage sp.]
MICRYISSTSSNPTKAYKVFLPSYPINFTYAFNSCT